MIATHAWNLKLNGPFEVVLLVLQTLDTYAEWCVAPTFARILLIILCSHL